MQGKVVKLRALVELSKHRFICQDMFFMLGLKVGDENVLFIPFFYGLWGFGIRKELNRNWE